MQGKVDSRSWGRTVLGIPDEKKDQYVWNAGRETESGSG